MRAVLVRDGKGDAGALFLGDAPRPAPGPGQVLVTIRAFGLNRMDIMQRNGAYPGAFSLCEARESRGLTARSAEGRERDPRRRVRGDRRARRAAAGGGRRRRGGEGSARGDRALEAGRRCVRARVRYACLPSAPLGVADRLSCPQGAYAEHIVSPATHLIPKPASLSLVDAASIPEVWLTGACRLTSRALAMSDAYVQRTKR
jgi:NADPH:quinone reductase-like Zn-dependent oxidoreductase